MRPGLSLLLFTGLFATQYAQAQTRIGYVDMKQLLDNAPQITLNREALDREFRPRNDAIERDEERLQVMLEQASTGNQTDDSLQNRIRNLQLSINRRREDLRQELLFRRNTAIQDLEDDINQAVASVARNQSYDLILSSPVIYANNSVDLTDEVLEYLRRQTQTDE